MLTSLQTSSHKSTILMAGFLPRELWICRVYTNYQATLKRGEHRTRRRRRKSPERPTNQESSAIISDILTFSTRIEKNQQMTVYLALSIDSVFQNNLTYPERQNDIAAPILQVGQFSESIGNTAEKNLYHAFNDVAHRSVSQRTQRKANLSHLSRLPLAMGSI